MAKKKTSVILPGGIAGLVQSAQQGIQQPPLAETLNDGDTAEIDKPNDIIDESKPETLTTAKSRQAAGDKKVKTGATQQKNKNTKETAEPTKNNRVGEKPSKTIRSAAATQQRNDKPSAEPANSTPINERSYSLTPKNSADESWQMFLDMAHEYKQRQAPIATIYIDEELKRVLDRLKTAGPSRLTTTSIVSSIVARFIFDHEREIKELLYKEL
ncbi:MAG: hypothetical protein IKP16_03710 [Prevotella sp.]|nr:hypothetical protein [Prevotella sp.]